MTDESKIVSITESVPVKKESVFRATAVGTVATSGAAFGLGSLANVLKQTSKQEADIWKIEAKSYNKWTGWAGLLGAVVGGVTGYLSARDHNKDIDEVSHQVMLETQREKAKTADAALQK